jgi:hypothetical protein
LEKHSSSTDLYPKKQAYLEILTKIIFSEEKETSIDIAL